MTSQVIAVRANMPFKEIVDILADKGISAVPVVDDEDRVIGVVSEADLLHKTEFAGQAVANRPMETRRRRTAREKAAGDVAGALMTSPAVTVTADTSVVAAARMMERKEVKRLPVVDRQGYIVGIASRRDLLKAFLRPDAEIEADILEQVFRRVMWVDETSVSVAVTGGVATLSGELERRSLIPIAVRLTRGVDGVVDVVDRLTYRIDDTAERRSSRYLNPP
jgi:CBS domain-containing protein